MSWQTEQAPNPNPDSLFAIAERTSLRQQLLREASVVLKFAQDQTLIVDLEQADVTVHPTHDEPFVSEVAVEIRSSTPEVVGAKEIAPEIFHVTQLKPSGQTARKLRTAQPSSVATVPKQRGVTVDAPPRAKPVARARRGKTEKEDSVWNSDIIKAYLKDIGRHPLLTQAEEVYLSKTVQAGLHAKQQQDTAVAEGVTLPADEQRTLEDTIKAGALAKERFINSNLRLVVSIAKRYIGSGVPLLDLIQDGNMGVMHAVEKFDWRKGFKFSTYATWWIRQSISRGIADKSRMIRLPVHQADSLRLFRLTEVRFETDAEIAQEMGISIREVNKLRMLKNIEPSSYDETFSDDRDSSSLLDLLGDEHSDDGYEATEMSMITSGLNTALQDVLSERELIVITERFGLQNGEPKTLEQTAEILSTSQKSSFTRERIRQIQTIAMIKLKHPTAHRVIQLLGDTENEDWKINANCLGVPVKTIFEPRAIENPVGRPRRIPRGKDPRREMCEDCSVRASCYNLAVSLQVDRGLWAGEIYSSSKKAK